MLPAREPFRPTPPKHFQRYERTQRSEYGTVTNPGGGIVDLVATLAAPPVKNTPGRSVMDDWVDGLPEGEREAVMAAVVNPAWGHVALRDVLVDAGAPFLADTSIRMWRTKLGWRRES